MNHPGYKTDKELYEEALQEFRSLSTANIRLALRQASAMHTWAVLAYKTVLRERGE